MSLPPSTSSQQQPAEATSTQRIFPMLPPSRTASSFTSSSDPSSPLASRHPLDGYSSAAPSSTATSSYSCTAMGGVGATSTCPSRPKLAPSSRDSGSMASISSFGLTSPVDMEQRRSRDSVDDWAVKTRRFEHHQLDDGDYVLTGREGKLERCEDEPIHVPGAIQAFGALLAFDQHEDGRLQVMQCSENSGMVLDIEPHELLSADSLASFLPEASTLEMADALELVDRPRSPGRERLPQSFRMAWEGKDGTQREGDCVIHRPSPLRQPQRVVLEVELVDDVHHPLAPPASPPHSPSAERRKAGLPTPAERIVEQDELNKATESILDPLTELNRWRRRKRMGVKAEVDYMSLVTDITEQLSLAAERETREVFWNMVARLYKEICEFARVMVYEFDAQWNGHVVGEQADIWKLRDVFRGLVWPASDVPPQARKLYAINKCRLLYDVAEPTARLVCRNAEEVDNPLDMTHCYLRAMSPIHLKYLANMEVKSSMSVSIMAFGRLHALIALHDYGDHGRRIAPQLRKLCTMVSDAVSINLERLIYRERLEARQVVTTQVNDSAAGLIATPLGLLEIMNAHFGCLTIAGSTKLIGEVENSEEVLAIVGWLRRQGFSTTVSSHNINLDFPQIGASYSPGVHEIAGFLAIPLTHDGADHIIFFRRSEAEEIRWAGNPYLAEQEGRRLEPRTSFKLWRELITGQARPWTEAELEQSSQISFAYGKFIKIWRQAEGNAEADRRTKLLLGNAAHEARTPLNAVVGYLDLALQEEGVEGELRESLTRSATASKSLINVVNDLLDLAKGEGPPAEPVENIMDMETMLEEATSMHRQVAQQKGLRFGVVSSQTSPCPRLVVGDASQLHKVVSNLCANAVQHTITGGVLVQWGIEEQVIIEGDESAGQAHTDEISVAISITDTGCGMSPSVLEALFLQLEEVAQLESGEGDAPSIGLGLAVVSQIVKNLGGQLRVQSTLGAGTSFTFVVPLHLPQSFASTTQPTRVMPPQERWEMNTLLSELGKSHMAPPEPAPCSAESSGTFARVEDAAIASTRPPPTAADSTTVTPRPRLVQPPASSPAVLQVPEQSAISQVRRPSLADTVRSTSSPCPQEPKLLEKEREQKPVRSLKVMVVDDEPINRRILEKMLTRDGHFVKTCQHGGECMKLLEEDPEWDLLLLDLQMPHMSGYEAVCAVRLHETAEPYSHRLGTLLNADRLPVFACSAHVEGDQLPALAEMGFDGFLSKPIDMKKLKRLVAGVEDAECRREEVERGTSGKWAQGGWFGCAKERRA